MALNDNDSAVCTDSFNEEAVISSAGEIDLYDELIAFAELSPEEQLRLVVRPEPVREGKIEAHPILPEAVLTLAQIKPVEAEMSAVDTETATAEEAEEHTFTEPVPTFTLIEPVELPTTAPAAESDSEPSKAYVQPRDAGLQGQGPRPSGPLSGFNLPPDIVYTGALSRGVCLACGAESDADDLFCITCGVFIDEIASTLPVKPTCEECKQGIAADEIFCPWCGSVLPAA